MSNSRQRGEIEGMMAVFLTVLMAVAMVFVVVMLSAQSHRAKHHARLVKTRDHRLLVQNDNGSWWAYVFKAAEKMPDIELPVPGSDDFKLPPGSWQRVPAPGASEIEEDEEATIEEMDTGEPSEDVSGNIGEDSDGNSPADSGGDAGDSGGDAGGDGGE